MHASHIDALYSEHITHNLSARTIDISPPTRGHTHEPAQHFAAPTARGLAEKDTETATCVRRACGGVARYACGEDARGSAGAGPQILMSESKAPVARAVPSGDIDMHEIVRMRGSLFGVFTWAGSFCT